LRSRGKNRRWLPLSKTSPARFATTAAFAGLPPRAAVAGRALFFFFVSFGVADVIIFTSNPEPRRPGQPRHGAGGERQGLERRRQRKERNWTRSTGNSGGVAALVASSPLRRGRRSGPSGTLEAREGGCRCPGVAVVVAVVAAGGLFFLFSFLLF
jgi:hypothetical protein